MLIGLDPLLDPDLLWTLRAMGHGDRIAIVDANFPAASLARRLHRLDGADAVTALTVILTVLPVDDFALPGAFCMTPTEDGALPPIAEEFSGALERAGHAPQPGGLSRQRFYDAARDCFAVVQTGERRLFGNIVLTKGVVRIEAA